ncbi:MAG: DNA cytosine methyltransferase [Nanoarchaeota archaeon]|nr:DNA cytosine methyltransferase [Nanoarchaeota archaeon]
MKRGKNVKLTVASFFSGCGGLDLGFKKAGFKITFANDYDRDIWETFEKNHNLTIDRRSIRDIDSKEVPDCDGIIGGPPCQSWSLAGTMKGLNDNRGKLFYEYIRIIQEKNPKFFVAENVAGILSSTHKPEFDKIINKFDEIGYNVEYKLVNAKDFGVPQDRKRVIVVGYRKDLNKTFSFPNLLKKKVTLKDSIFDLSPSLPALEKNKPNNNLVVPNQEYMIGSFSTIYLSRNRRRDWKDVSFTIQAGGRHAPLHPSSPEMIKIGKDEWKFNGNKSKIKRLSIRECARIQTFPEDFIFHYDNVSKGYKMIGNAVPVNLAKVIAKKIYSDLAN